MSNARVTITGCLFDLFARGREMVVWVLADDGRRIRLVDRSFVFTGYIDGPRGTLRACARTLERNGDARVLGWCEKRDFWSGDTQRVLAVQILDLASWHRALSRYHQRFPRLAWYNADLPPEQVYCYDRDTFPLAQCRFETTGDELLGIETCDDRWAVDYPSPPVRIARLGATGSLLGRRPRLESLTLADNDGTTLSWDEPDYLLPSFQAALDRLDPDVLVTRRGDAFIMPLLLTVAHRTRFGLRLDREDPPAERRVRTDGRSFMSYGRVLYHAPEYPLYGRWHLDLENSFMASHAGLEGVYEVARLSRIPAQRIGRRSIGTGITSVQLDLAYRENYLIPWKKTHPEAWKSASQLLRTDRGGLVYAPETGLHENVVELDFVSMYPTIMSRFNVSPETVNCACCRNSRVPEIGYTICEKRAGLVSRALAPIIEKRVRYKALRAGARRAGDHAAYDRNDLRQSALKWMLVCCFGYLGYRNARFGRIEAHEAVSAYSRELLLRAREVCEEHGWRLLHANVDCVWIVKPGFERAEIDTLRRHIDAATGLDIALEGIYRWVAFLPSRQFPGRPVPARYFGVFEDGELKFRGIECRRSDLPAFVKTAQRTLLEVLANARGRTEYEAAAASLLESIAELEGQLWRHEVPLDELAIRGSLSREPEEYRGNGPQALAARQSATAGLNLHAGQTLEYVIVDGRDPDRERRVRLAPLLDAETLYDSAAYVRLLRRAMNSLLWPAGLELEEKRIEAPWCHAHVPTSPNSPRDAQLDFLNGDF